VGLLVAGDLDAGGGVGEPHGGERHAGHRLVEITAAGGEAVDNFEVRHQWWKFAHTESGGAMNVFIEIPARRSLQRNQRLAESCSCSLSRLAVVGDAVPRRQRRIVEGLRLRIAARSATLLMLACRASSINSAMCW